MENLFSNVPADLSSELVETLLDAANVRVERIVSYGQSSADGFWYDQPWNEWVTVLQGAARLQLENGEAVEMKIGDVINIPAHRKHRIEWTTPNEPTIWLAIHYP